MKGKLAAAFLTFLCTAGVLAGCAGDTIVFEKKEMPVREAEELLGDRMELENPGLDVEVDIITEKE